MNEGADEDIDSQEQGVYFCEEDEVENHRQGTNVDYFETVVEKIFWVRTSHPVFFLDSENADHDIFEVDQVLACLFACSLESSERVTENGNEVEGEGNLSAESDEAKEKVEEGGKHLEGL